jgi:hypothetical protein
LERKKPVHGANTKPGRVGTKKVLFEGRNEKRRRGRIEMGSRATRNKS